MGTDLRPSSPRSGSTGPASTHTPGAEPDESGWLWFLFCLSRHFRRMLAALAGYDLDLVRHYAGPDAEHERKRLVRMGFAVVIPAFLGLFTAFFFLGPFVEVLPTRIVMAVVSSLFILVVDIIVVTTLSKHGGVGTLIRILISACMGIVISEPLLISLYQKTIDAQISVTLEREKAERQHTYDTQLSQDDKDYEQYRKLLAQDVEELAKLQPAALAARHAKEQRQERDELVKDIRAHRDDEITQLNQQRNELGDSRRKTQDAIESKTLDMEKEADGKRASGKTGKGPIHAALQKNLKSLNDDLNRINDLITNLDSRIEALHRDTSAEDRVGASLGATTAGVGLTPDEKLAKEQLEADVAARNASLATISRHQDDVRKAIAHLPEEFALSTRNDSLSQTQALYEILQVNRYLQIKVAALFLLLFLIDVAPVVVKLTVRTGYDQYLRMLASKRYENEVVDRDAYDNAVFALGTRKVDRRIAFGKKAAEGIAAADIMKVNSKRVKAVSIKAARAAEQQVDDTFAESRVTGDAKPSRSLFAWLTSALKAGFWALRSKFGT